MVRGTVALHATERNQFITNRPALLLRVQTGGLPWKVVPRNGSGSAWRTGLPWLSRRYILSNYVDNRRSVVVTVGTYRRIDRMTTCGRPGKQRQPSLPVRGFTDRYSTRLTCTGTVGSFQAPDSTQNAPDRVVRTDFRSPSHCRCFACRHTASVTAWSDRTTHDPIGGRLLTGVSPQPASPADRLRACWGVSTSCVHRYR